MGIEAAVAEAVEAFEPREVEQFELLPYVPVKRGAGRPAGSRSRSTEEFRRFVFGQFGDPSYELASFTVMPLAQLRQALGCTLLEAADFKRKCIADLMPYLHQRMPQAIQLGADGEFTLVLAPLARPRAEQPLQIEENQGVSE